jgi:lysophospholipase L1-like esterase
MRVKLLFLLALVVLAALPSTASAQRTRYYVSLGDSLSVGEQPRAGDGLTVLTGAGYVDDIFKFERRRIRGLREVKFGCGGERVSTIARSSVACFYAGAHNQLGAAINFMRAHRGQIAFVTIDIGANDVDSCDKSGGIDVNCVTTGFNAIKQGLPGVARRLRSAAGRHTRIVGMNYYDPFLEQWLSGSSGQSVARASVSLADQFNGIIAAAYRAQHIRVADVAGAFKTDDLTDMTSLPGFGQVPVNVANICNFTWMCAAAPVGPNIHARPAGYKLIAGVFEKQLRGVR